MGKKSVVIIENSSMKRFKMLSINNTGENWQSLTIYGQSQNRGHYQESNLDKFLKRADTTFIEFINFRLNDRYL